MSRSFFIRPNFAFEKQVETHFDFISWSYLIFTDILTLGQQIQHLNMSDIISWRDERISFHSATINEQTYLSLQFSSFVDWFFSSQLICWQRLLRRSLVFLLLFFSESEVIVNL